MLRQFGLSCFHKSRKTPSFCYFVLFCCFLLCMQELESNGVGMASVHGSRQYDVTSHCNIDRIPAIVAVVNRRVSHYRGHLQARNIRSFVKNALPSWIITEVQVSYLHLIEVIYRAYSCFTVPNYLILIPHKFLVSKCEESILLEVRKRERSASVRS